jgi:hypothetical protein
MTLLITGQRIPKLVCCVKPSRSPQRSSTTSIN